MSTTSAPLTDSRIMLRRNLKHILRNPVTIFNGALMPVVIMLLFVYVLGNAFNVGEHYIEYATPGLIVLAITYGLSATAVSVNSDMAKGIINRFKVMNVSRGAVLTGSTRDDADLTLRLPSDGGVKSVRALLDRLAEHSINVEEFSVHTPDLDDVFLALTSHASTEAIAQ